MGRSKFSEDQAVDRDFASEVEVTTVSGILRDHTTTVSGHLQTGIDAKPDNFLDLPDTPPSYVGYRKKLVRVNEGSDGLEFVGGEAVGDEVTFSGIIPHSILLELDEDQHPALVPRDGSRGFTSTVSGVDPTQPYHITTKNFVDYEITTTSGYLHNHLKGRYISDDIPADDYAYLYSAVEEEWHPIYLGDFIDSYGVGFYYSTADEDEESMNSTSWINRLTLTASGVQAGKYRLGWYYEYRVNKAGKDLLVRISLNDDLVNLLHDVDLSMIQTTNYVSSAGFYHETLISGTYHIDLDWRLNSAQGGTAAYLRRVRLEFWRVN